MVGQIMHFVWPCLVAREILDRGELGKPVTGSSSLRKIWMEANRRGWHLDPATGGGMLMTAGIHALDQLVWLMDGRVGSVSAAASASFHDQKADDSAMMLLRFNDGRFAQVASIGFRDGGGTFDLDLVCEHGTLRIDFERGVSIGRGGKWADVPNSHDPAWMHNGVVREWQAMAAAIAARHGCAGHRRLRPPHHRVHRRRDDFVARTQGCRGHGVIPRSRRDPPRVTA